VLIVTEGEGFFELVDDPEHVRVGRLAGQCLRAVKTPLSPPAAPSRSCGAKLVQESCLPPWPKARAIGCGRFSPRSKAPPAVGESTVESIATAFVPTTDTNRSRATAEADGHISNLSSYDIYPFEHGPNHVLRA
jgi:hypothetical protein